MRSDSDAIGFIVTVSVAVFPTSSAATTLYVAFVSPVKVYGALIAVLFTFTEARFFSVTVSCLVV